MAEQWHTDLVTEPQNPQDPHDGHLTAAQAAAILRVSTDTVYRHGHRLGSKVLGRWRFDPDRIAAACSGTASTP